MSDINLTLNKLVSAVESSDYSDGSVSYVNDGSLSSYRALWSSLRTGGNAASDSASGSYTISWGFPIDIIQVSVRWTTYASGALGSSYARLTGVGLTGVGTVIGSINRFDADSPITTTANGLWPGATGITAGVAAGVSFGSTSSDSTRRGSMQVRMYDITAIGVISPVKLSGPNGKIYAFPRNSDGPIRIAGAEGNYYGLRLCDIWDGLASPFRVWDGTKIKAIIHVPEGVI